MFYRVRLEPNISAYSVVWLKSIFDEVLYTDNINCALEFESRKEAYEIAEELSQDIYVVSVTVEPV